MRNIKALIILIVACVFIWDVGAAEHLRSSNIFGSEMVLQRHKPVPIWGWAQEDAHVTVTFAGQTKTTKAEKTGRWEIKLDSMEASAVGRIMVITSGNEELKFTNILVGEVWLASGQSNMGVDLGGSDMPKSELKQLNKPLIRNFKVLYATAASPLDNLSLPDPLTTGAGDKVTTVAQWQKTRRPELLELFRTNVYGRAPIGRPDTLRFDVKEIDKNAMDGKATLKRVEIHFSGPGGKGMISLVVFIPNNVGKPVPGFLLICNRDRDNIDPTRTKKSPFWPAERIVEHGYVAATFHNSDLDPDTGCELIL